MSSPESELSTPKDFVRISIYTCFLFLFLKVLNDFCCFQSLNIVKSQSNLRLDLDLCRKLSMQGLLSKCASCDSFSQQYLMLTNRLGCCCFVLPPWISMPWHYWVMQPYRTYPVWSKPSGPSHKLTVSSPLGISSSQRLIPGWIFGEPWSLPSKTKLGGE